MMRSVSVSSRVACWCEEVEDGGGGAVEDDLDVGVAGGPEIFEERLGELLGEGGGGVAEIVEGFAEWGAPLLVPAGFAAVAAAVGAPALDAVERRTRRCLRRLRPPTWEEIFRGTRRSW